MARKISFTKAEMEAVRFFLREHEEHWTQVAAECHYKADRKRIEQTMAAARSLLAKMDAPGDPEPAKDGVAASEFCRLLSGSIVEPATKMSWVILQRQLVSEPFSQSDLLELDLSWANSPIPALTVARKGKDWLAKQRAARKGKPGKTIATGAPADMEFDDE